MSAIEGVECDGCGDRRTRTAVGMLSAKGVRRALKQNSAWHTTRGTWTGAATGKEYGYTRDICPQCWAKGIR